MFALSKIFVAALMLVGTPAAIGAHTAHAEPIKDRVLEEGRITIGIHNRAPWGFRTEAGEVAGFHPDMIEAVLGPVGIDKVEFVVMDFGALIPSLLARRIDVVASGMAITPVRCEQVVFSDPDLAIGDGVLVKADNPLNIHSYADIAANPQIRLGGGRGSSNTENALKAGVPETQLQQFQSVEAGVAALLAGRIDAATYSSATAISVLKDPNIKGIERATPFTGLVENGREAANYAAIAFRPEDTALRDLYNESLRERKADGTVDTIMAKYDFTSAEAAPEGLTARELCPDNYR
ncbi:ectoine/hydroxyectoine ABC transporter substrate-binding protein EhuB [Chelativorans xinjiangense]|uniref:ectoine/hydroxyectoine ABC transporter substrate-binding protein EhuB n=1 Tax=Chelativorans xinjiangense TaxID=2681485 RepID=UPI00135C9137|nr:ectoine/hydroxyectoine ABC transporter substrate-binding protein EhuB [Chelativorans xinjiangense]